MGYRVQLLRVSPTMEGQTLAEMGLRARFDVNIVAIRSPGSSSDPAEMPDPGRRLTLQDMLVVVGDARCIERMVEFYGIPP